MPFSDVYLVILIFFSLSFISEAMKFSAVFLFKKMDPVRYCKKGLTWVRIANQLLYSVITVILIIFCELNATYIILGIILSVISLALQGGNIYFKKKLGGKDNESKNSDM